MESLRVRTQRRRLHSWAMSEAQRTYVYDQLKHAPRVGIDIPYVSLLYGFWN